MLNTLNNENSNLYQRFMHLIDDDGFLTVDWMWNDELCQDIAYMYGVGELNRQHWRVISALRDHYVDTGKLLSIKNLERTYNIRAREVYKWFKEIGRAYQLAGLPNPDSISNSHNYIESQFVAG